MADSSSASTTQETVSEQLVEDGVSDAHREEQFEVDTERHAVMLMRSSQGSVRMFVRAPSEHAYVVQEPADAFYQVCQFVVVQCEPKY